MEDIDAQAQPFWPELEELARPARERRRLPPDTRSAIILRLCERAPLSVKELSLLLQRSEAYIGDAIRPLVTAGDLTFIYPDQPRHPRQKYVSASPSPPQAPLAAAPAPAPAAAPKPSPNPAAHPAAPARPATPTGSATATASADAPADPPPPRFPNHWTNLAYVIVIGVALGLNEPRIWLAIAAIAAVALSWLHIWVGSAQYRRFNTLQTARDRATTFVLFKSAVTLVEITVIYLAASAFQSTP